MKNNDTFSFGKNWDSFIKNYLSQERIAEAKSSLVRFLNMPDLKNKTFIDVGCGSGIFSLAAYYLGASKIISFDADKESINCCQYLKQSVGDPLNWKVLQGSILDKKFITKLGKFNIVYSWGVLHHTGKMWEAIKNSLGLMDSKGLIYLAIYNKCIGLSIYPDGRFGSSKFWEKEKKIYSKLPGILQNCIDYSVISILILLYLILLKNPVKIITNHKKQFRGMSWRIDIKDWLGGYPYEYASVDEIFNFVKQYNYELLNLKYYHGLGNNEFLFKKK